MNVKQEVRRLIKEALQMKGGTGGIKTCQYCLRDSMPGTTRPGAVQHYRKGVKDEAGVTESDEHCVVVVLKQVLKELP